MRSGTIFSAIAIAVLCITVGFIAVATTLDSAKAEDHTKRTVQVGDTSGNRKPFSYRLFGDEGGSGKPFSLNKTI
ncbi:MAG TPA: hypothetical protein VMS94_03430 [Acidobacteriota bacterium]|nr:hypothetical protein [Acidobacteriota bacterium]